jgi:hypothetical protein
MATALPSQLASWPACLERCAVHAAKRITSDVMGQMLLGEDLQGKQWK